MCAAEDAYFNIERSEKFFKVNESFLKPLIPKFERPKPSHSGTSTVA
jgi:hypothetical protein